MEDKDVSVSSVDSFNSTMSIKLPKSGPIKTAESADKEIDQINREKILDNDDKEQTIELKRFYSKWTFIGVGVWIAIALMITFLQGFKIGGFYLTQLELITLLSTTTIAIIGVLLVVFKHIFKSPN